MKLSDLIVAVGDENVVMQNLLNDVASLDQTKSGTKVTFYTDQIHPADLISPEKTKKVGLVVWLPRDRVDEAIAAEKAKAVDPLGRG